MSKPKAIFQNINFALLVELLGILSSSCGTILHGTTQNINVTSEPSGADVLSDSVSSYVKEAEDRWLRENEVVAIKPDQSLTWYRHNKGNKLRLFFER